MKHNKPQGGNQFGGHCGPWNMNRPPAKLNKGQEKNHGFFAPRVPNIQQAQPITDQDLNLFCIVATCLQKSK